MRFWRGLRAGQAILGSRFGRRLFLLFIGSALLPISALAFISYTRVSNQLQEQSYEYLHQGAKNLGMLVFLRLIDLEATLSLDTGERSPQELFASDVPPARLGSDAGGFSDVALCRSDGSLHVLKGAFADVPQLDAVKRRDLRAGKTVILSRQDSADGGATGLIMLKPLPAAGPDEVYLLGQLGPDWLAGPSGETLTPPMTEMHLRDGAGNLLLGSLPGAEPPRHWEASDTHRADRQCFRWGSDDEDYLAAYWTLFLGNRFASDKWTVFVSRRLQEIMTPAAGFRRVFPHVVLLSFWMIMLLSHIQIRRTLKPLRELKMGTARVAGGDFGQEIEVTSRDELQDLAESFNHMTRRLGRQFNTLSGIAEIDRAILSALSTDAIVELVTTRLGRALACEAVNICLMSRTHKNRGTVFHLERQTGKVREAGGCVLSPYDLRKLAEHPDHHIIVVDDYLPGYLWHIGGGPPTPYLVLPLRVEEALLGVLTIAYQKGAAESRDGAPLREIVTYEEIGLARQLADQVSVALANARLVEELDQFNWGTLRALARAVDAMSPWTAGHSERVTRVALCIGEIMGLDLDELQDLERAALLHDIGKLGIPDVILDKRGSLDDSEIKRMKTHPTIGARILEPIAAYANIVPIIQQHHEFYNGEGYPDGLAGDELTLGGRILAVADVYDALSSDRPYRKGWSKQKVESFIVEHSGSRFDPAVVDALLQAKGSLNAEPAAEASGDEAAAPADDVPSPA